MAYSTPLTAVSGTALTAAQWNASMRDDMLVTPAALASAAGQMWVSTAANAGAMRTPSFTHTSAASTTSSNGTWADLAAGAGPVVAVTTGVSAIVAFGAAMSNGTGGGNCNMSYAVTGATSIPADGTHTIRFISPNSNDSFAAGRIHFQSGLTPGTNTFTAKYQSTTGGVQTYSERHLMVIPL